MLERAIVSGVAHDTSEAKVTIAAVPDRPGIAASLFRPFADGGINVDMIVQNVSEAGHTDISFTLPQRRPRASSAGAGRDGCVDGRARRLGRQAASPRCRSSGPE